MGLAVFLVSFLLYSYTAIPVIFYEDNPEFITTAYTLGIAHPSGYPLINILGNIAGLLPFGNFAYRCNIMSALFGAIAVYFFFRCSFTLSKEKFFSGAAALIFMLSGNLWTQSSIMEVYTLHYALFFSVFWISLSGRLIDFRWLLISSFLFGFAITNHLSFALGLIPFSLLWIAKRSEWRYRMDIGKFGLVLLAGLLSWSVHLYLPARSMSGTQDILFSWGRIDSLSSFMGNITGFIYSDLPFNKGNMQDRLNIMMDYFSNFPIWAWAISIVPFVFGIMKMLALSVSGSLAFLLGIVAFFFYSLLHYAAIDIMMVIPWGLSLLVIFFGIARLGNFLKKATASVLTILAIYMYSNGMSEYDRHEDYTAYDYMVDVFETVPPDGRLETVAGFEENYILFYSTFGPAAIYPKTGESENAKLEPFFPYLSLEVKTSATYSLFNMAHPYSGKYGDMAIWNYIRSFNLDKTHLRFREGPLTRSAYKGAVLARIAVQKGHALMKNGDKQKAGFFYQLAAKWNTVGVLKEATIRDRWGETDTSIAMIEASLKSRPTTYASALLAKIRLAEKKGDRPAFLPDTNL
ncbi:MAG: DUF2723 domain-containing protein [Nitrospinota bacterium]|nr:DUF2723 domain-containing protein [Nitrospinota bacterium]